MNQQIKNLGKSLGPRGRGPFTCKAEAGFGVSGQMGMKKQHMSILLCLLLPSLAGAAGPYTVAIDDLNLGTVTQAFWGPPQAGKSVTEQPLSLAGRKFERGLGTHAPGSYAINLHGTAKRFHAWVGVNDAAQGGSVDFKLVGDGKVLWESGPIRGRETAKEAGVDLAGVKRLELVVGDAGDGNSLDHAVWADAVIEGSGEKPEAFPHLLDASDPRPILPVGRNSWGGVGAKGEKFTVTSQSVEIDGKPVVLMAGEIHPTRTNAAAWEESILKMKAGGLNTVSFYVIWSHLEKEPGEFDFTGNRDIRKFVELCQKHGMYVWLRPGPYVNSEVLAGGLPQWLFGLAVTERSNDPGYLDYVKRYYGKVGEQLKGMMFKDGGPIVAIQLENEYGVAPVIWDYPFPGAGLGNSGTDGEEHMMKLKKIAREAGLDAPLYTATGWGGSPVPAGEFLVTSGAYSYLGDGPPTEASTFSDLYDRKPDWYQYPWAYVELGAGCPVQTTWRPIVPPESAEVTLLTRAACGGSSFCMYMYHGGTNPFGTRGPINIERWMPAMTYDWSAPIGEFGRMRDSYRSLRPLQHFLSDFPDLFAPTVTVWPGPPVVPGDTHSLRYIARVNPATGGGFLFLSNYQDKLKLPDRKGVRIELKLRDETITIPEDARGMDLASNAMAVLPFNLAMDGAKLKYATAQLMAELNDGARRTWVFFAPKGMAAQYVFDAATVKDITGATPVAAGGTKVVAVAEPGTGAAFEVTPVKGAPFRILTLTRQQAEHSFKADDLWGAPRLVLSENDVIADDQMLRVSQVGNGKLSFALYPAPPGKINGPSGAVTGTADGIFTRYAITLPKQEIKAEISKPADGKLMVKVPKEEFDKVNDVFLRVEYAGDRGWAFIGSHLVTDNFNNGTPWELGLGRWREKLATDGLFLRVAPWHQDASKVLFDGITFKPVANAKEPAAIKSAELVPEYAAEFRAP